MRFQTKGTFRSNGDGGRTFTICWTSAATPCENRKDRAEQHIPSPGKPLVDPRYDCLDTDSLSLWNNCFAAFGDDKRERKESESLGASPLVRIMLTNEGRFIPDNSPCQSMS